MRAERIHGDSYPRAGLRDHAVNVRAGRPPDLNAVLRAALAEERYPDPAPARRALARLHRVRPDEVLLLNGACEGFWLAAQALRPTEATVFQPSFAEGALALASVDARVRSVPLGTNWALEPARVPDRSRFIVVTNPNNPTGRLERPELLAELARPSRTLLVDESFLDFAAAGESLVGSGLPGLIVLRSCTKLLSLAGIRAGYLIAHRALVTRLEAARQAWPVNSCACAALHYFATERAAVNACIEEAARDREDLRTRLDFLDGVHIFHSAANFLLVRTRRQDVAERLRERGIAVRPSAGFAGLTREHVRITARSPRENETLARALRELLAGG